MHLQTAGASRPKLSLAFAGKKTAEAASERRSPTLSAHELRRIVADHIG